MTHSADPVEPLLPEDNSDIRIVDDRQREAWLTKEQKAQPSAPSQKVIDEIMAKHSADPVEPTTEAGSSLRSRAKRKKCSICGDAEPYHVHSGPERIEDYFTVGRGQSDLEAAQGWKAKYQARADSDRQLAAAMARKARLREAIENLPMHIRIETLDHDGFPSGDEECTTCGEDWPCPDSRVIEALSDTTADAWLKERDEAVVALKALVAAQEKYRDARNGLGHDGEKHDKALWPGPLPGGGKLYDLVGDCAACGGAQYVAEDSLHVAFVAAKIALGLPLWPFEEHDAEQARSLLASHPEQGTMVAEL
jgi:hypothetical protein